ncbi:MAG: DUF2100 domain-containing protein [Candidatus Helarchaeota archaeon]
MTEYELGKQEIGIIKRILGGALELKTILREWSPFHKLVDSELDQLMKILVSIEGEISDLKGKLADYGIKIEKKVLLKDYLMDKIIITTSKGISKILEKQGISKKKIMTINSPLTLEDFKEMNIKITEANKGNFERQIKKNWDLIRQVIDDNKEEMIFFVEDKNNNANQLIKKRLEEYFKEMNRKLDNISATEIKKE